VFLRSKEGRRHAALANTSFHDRDACSIHGRGLRSTSAVPLHSQHKGFEARSLECGSLSLLLDPNWTLWQLASVCPRPHVFVLRQSLADREVTLEDWGRALPTSFLRDVEGRRRTHVRTGSPQSHRRNASTNLPRASEKREGGTKQTQRRRMS